MKFTECRVVIKNLTIFGDKVLRKLVKELPTRRWAISTPARLKKKKIRKRQNLLYLKKQDKKEEQ
jgi:hypothetical protein